MQHSAPTLTSIVSRSLQVDAELTPVSGSQVNVQFKQFKILGLIAVNAPESAKGSLDTTFLDEEMRISRGDKGQHTTTCLKKCNTS